MLPVNTEQYYLAQVNTAKMRYSLEAPEMADFVAQINSINAVADADPGFVWRLRGEGAEDATSIRVFDDESILITLTVWKSLDALSNYVYRGAHNGIMRQRKRWFEKVEQPILAMWWICAGYTPTVTEAKKRLEHLQRYGSTPYAFSFQKPFSPIDAIEYEQTALALI